VYDRFDVSKSPSIEVLMTLLWAIQVIDKEGQQALRQDAATEARQVCGELDEILKARVLKMGRDSHTSGMRGDGTTIQKSLEDWRLGF